MTFIKGVTKHFRRMWAAYIAIGSLAIAGGVLLNARQVVNNSGGIKSDVLPDGAYTLAPTMVIEEGMGGGGETVWVTVIRDGRPFWVELVGGVIIWPEETAVPTTPTAPISSPTATAQTFPNALTASPTPIVPLPAATATRTPVQAITPTLVTPALATLMPCQFEANGAEPYMATGGSYFYRYTDPNNTGTSQNIRGGPNTTFPVVTTLKKDTPKQVYWQITTITGTWVSLDSGCTQWAAIWLGHVDDH